MPTYSKETALYDTGAIAAGLNAAGNTADTYITAVDENGITVHPARSNWSTTGGRTNINATGMTVYVGSDDVAFYGATARIGKSNSDRVTVDSTDGITIYKGNSKRLQTTANGIDVYGSDGSTSIASFGSSTRIGKPYVSGASNNESHMELDYHSLQLIDKEGNPYFHVSDLRDTDGVATIVDSWTVTSTASSRSFQLSGTADNTNYIVKDDGTTVPDAVLDRYTDSFVIRQTVGAHHTITAEYTVSSDRAMAYTFGKRYSSANVGCSSVAEGYDVIASGEYASARGYSAWAMDKSAVADGAETRARGRYSRAVGHGTLAYGTEQTALGRYNEADYYYALIIGNGTANNARSNAAAVDWLGNVLIDGDVEDLNGTKLYADASHVHEADDITDMVDYIIEQGTSGIWTYRKWSSGVSECWGAYTTSIAVSTAATGYGGYRSGNISGPNYPSGLFTAAPCVTATVSTSQGIWLNNLAGSTATKPMFYLSCGVSLSAADRTVNFHASGRWK